MDINIVLQIISIFVDVIFGIDSYKQNKTKVESVNNDGKKSPGISKGKFPFLGIVIIIFLLIVAITIISYKYIKIIDFVSVLFLFMIMILICKKQRQNNLLTDVIQRKSQIKILLFSPAAVSVLYFIFSLCSEINVAGAEMINQVEQHNYCICEAIKNIFMSNNNIGNTFNKLIFCLNISSHLVAYVLLILIYISLLLYPKVKEKKFGKILNKVISLWRVPIGLSFTPVLALIFKNIFIAINN